MRISYLNTVKVFFTKEMNEFASFIEANSYRRVLIVTGCNKTKSISDHLEEVLENCNVKILDGIETNASSNWIEKNLQEAKEFSPEVIVTVGGGSAHDSGKALAIMIESSSEYTIEDYTVNGKLSVPGIKKVLPVITIPTISGSGAEVSPAALIRIKNQKRVVFSPVLHPIATFINTDYFRSLNMRQVARSAFDSFIQASEGFVSTAANNLSNAFAVETIRYFNDVLPFLTNGRMENVSEDVLEKIAIASILSSYVCSTASVGAIHAISDPISGRYNVHHGTALAMVAEYVFKYNLQKVDIEVIEKLDTLLSNVDTAADNHTQSVISKVRKIVADLHLTDEVKDISFKSDELQDMAEESFNPDMAGNPYEFNVNEVIGIMRKYCHD